MKYPNENAAQRVVKSSNQTPLKVSTAANGSAVEDGKAKQIHQASTCLRLQNHASGGHGHSPGDPRGSSHQAASDLYPIEIKDGSLLAQVLEVFGDLDVVVESVTPEGEPTPFERKYFGGQPMYLRRDLEVVWRNAYRRALGFGLKPYRAEQVAWRRVNKKSQSK